MKPGTKFPVAWLIWILLIGAFLRSEPVLLAQQAPSGARDLFVTAGKSLVVESPTVIQRVSVADGKIAEAVAINPKEVLINGLAPGETSLVIWQQGGTRLLFDLKVRPSLARLDAVRQELEKELSGQEVSITLEGEHVFLRGTVNDKIAADRALEIASTLGKPVNLLYVKTPPAEQQILLKVRFANVDRAASQELGANIFSTGTLNTPGAVTTQQFQPPQVEFAGAQGATFNLTDALNIFLFRPDLDLGATIRALQGKRLLEMLAEPNLLAMNGQQASFLAGGEFPVPVVQSGIAGAGAVTIQWREFGVRINFLPTVTPRGTIRLKVAPEVSSLDYANAVVLQGFTIPAIATRKVQTDIELESGQSFLIAGLLDNRVIESFSKIPGIGDIPVLGKLFQSRSMTKNNTELLVAVTPELVRPIPAGQPVPGIAMPREFMKEASKTAPRTPGMDVTGPVPVKPVQEKVPVEQLKEAPAAPAAAPAIQIVPGPAPSAETAKPRPPN